MMAKLAPPLLMSADAMLRTHSSWILTAGLVANLSLLAGCTTTPESFPEEPAVLPSVLSTTSVTRYGRYTLVELGADAAQQDLLLQVIDLNLPSTWTLTVGDALRYVLLRSGYQLCDDSADAQTLYALPLPAAHLRLGPMVLRTALLTLAGPGWTLRVDDRARRLCFVQGSEQTMGEQP
jgi:type IV pili sensor histidine kinase/response regulator